MSEFVQTYLLNFPEHWVLRPGEAIDNAVKEFARDHKAGLRGFKDAVIAAVGGIEGLLRLIPWVVLVLLVFLLAWRLTRRLHTGALYAAMLTFIGCCGLWDKMIQTLAIIFAGFLVCMVLGFPLGVLIALSPRANRVIRPVLDTMQTMPSWVYLVPAVILFSTGKVPALIATTIYGMVPMVRMTSHGLTYVDREMLEAAQSFGSTKWQMLVKVQVPQALPTIMTGVNQTIMMCMSMVVTCALIGTEGLGMEIMVAINRTDITNSLLPGVCIVILAIIMDRLIQAGIRRMKRSGEVNPDD